jgi:N-acetylglucosamine-6-phosphate deacetylase
MPARQRIQSRPELVRNTLINLNGNELALAKTIAIARNASNRKEGVADNIQDKKRTSIQIDIDGAEAELAFFKLINTYPESFFDTTNKSKSTGTDLGDVFLDDFSIDVKSTRYKTGQLIQSGAKTFKSKIDMYCLIIKEEDNIFNMKGFYPSSLLLQEKNYGKHFPGRPCFAIKQNVLMDYDDCAKKVLTSSK